MIRIPCLVDLILFYFILLFIYSGELVQDFTQKKVYTVEDYSFTNIYLFIYLKDDLAKIGYILYMKIEKKENQNCFIFLATYSWNLLKESGSLDFIFYEIWANSGHFLHEKSFKSYFLGKNLATIPSEIWH